jgi:Helicase conserved C-terminal domain
MTPPVEEGGATGPTVRCTEPEAVANLAAVLRLCQTGKLTCSATTRRPSAATVRAVADVLVAGDFYPDDAIAAFAWPLLLQAGGLVRLEGTRLALTPQGGKALGRPAHDVLRAIWQRWPRHAPIDELSRVEQIKGQKAAAALSAAGPRRQAAAAALTHCPPGEWIAVDALFSVVGRRVSLTVARSERGLWKLYIGDPEYGSLGYAGYHDWPILEGRYLLAVLFEYAATLGLLDVVYVPPAGARDDFRDMWGADWIDALSRYDGLRAVRLTPLGAYAAGLSETYVPAATGAPPRALEVLANLDVVAVADLPPGDGLVLDAFAARTSERVWTLSMASLLAAVDAGRSPGELAAFLADRAAHGVPAAVRRLLDDVEARAGRVRDLGLKRVVECADAQLATLLARDRALGPRCTRVGARHLLIDPADEAEARAVLRKLGHPLGPPAR